MSMTDILSVILSLVGYPDLYRLQRTSKAFRRTAKRVLPPDDALPQVRWEFACSKNYPKWPESKEKLFQIQIIQIVPRLHTPEIFRVWLYVTYPEKYLHPDLYEANRNDPDVLERRNKSLLDFFIRGISYEDPDWRSHFRDRTFASAQLRQLEKAVTRVLVSHVHGFMTKKRYGAIMSSLEKAKRFATQALLARREAAIESWQSIFERFYEEVEDMIKEAIDTRGVALDVPIHLSPLSKDLLLLLVRLLNCVESISLEVRSSLIEGFFCSHGNYILDR